MWKKASRGKNRDRDETLIAVGHSHQQRGTRHFRNVEFAKVELTPEHLRWVRRTDHKIHAVRFYVPFAKRPSAVVIERHMLS